MKCNNCGHENKQGAQVCKNCGANLYQANSKDCDKIINILSYLWILFFLPLVVCPGSKTGKFHANQGLTLLIVGLVGSIAIYLVGMVVGLIPLLGWIISGLISFAWSVAMLALMIIGMLNANKSLEKPLPVIGKLFTLIK